MRTRTALLAAAAAAALAVPAPAGAGKDPGVWTPTLQATQGFDHLSAFADGTMYAQYADSYARSRDAGLTWQVMPRPPRQYLGSPGIRFATPEIGWSVAGTGIGVEDVANASGFAAEILQCGALTPLHRTIDGGQTWQPVCVPNTKPTDANPWFDPVGSPLAVGSDGRTVMLTGTERRPDNTSECGGTTDAIYSSRDAGKTWRQARLPKGWHAGYRSQVYDSSTMAHLAYYAKAGECATSTVGLFVSRDGGASFQRVVTCPEQPACTSFAMVTRSRILLGRTDGSTQFSTDGGRRWKRGERLFERSYQPAIDSGQVSPYMFWAQALSFSDAKHGYASTRGSGTWRTVDGGVSWTQERSHECTYHLLGVGEVAAGSPATAITGGPAFISARAKAPHGESVEGCGPPGVGDVSRLAAGVVADAGAYALRADGTLILRP